MISVLIKTKRINEKHITDRVIKYRINIINLYEKDEFLYIKLPIEDYDRLCSYDYKKEIIFIKYYGFKGLTNFYKRNIKRIIIPIIISILIFLSRFLIISVNIHSQDKNLSSVVKYYLIDRNIDSFTLKKSYKKLEEIKNELLNKYHDDIEWIEISQNGYDYNVYLIKRKIGKKNDKSKDKCNYVAKKSGTITSITAKTGVIIVQENNYVNAGDILISGSIIYNDEIKNEVCAKGKILGEVWYKVDIEYPLVKYEEIIAKKKNYNITLNIFNHKYKIFKDKYNHNKSVFHIGFKKFGIGVEKSYKTKRKKMKYTEEEAINLALEKAKNSVLLKLPKGSKILSENILKKSINNDKIYIEVFITSEEELGVVEKY